MSFAGSWMRCCTLRKIVPSVPGCFPSPTKMRVYSTSSRMLQVEDLGRDVGSRAALGLTIRARCYHPAMSITAARQNASARGVLAPACALFRGLADPTRLALLQRLARGEARVVDLVSDLGMAQSTVSAHLSCLRECGLVDFRPQGRASVYFLARPELMDLLGSAETLLAATGYVVELCPVYGTSASSVQDVQRAVSRDVEVSR